MNVGKLLGALALLGTMGTTQAASDLQITEIWFGLDGPDGTQDWFEVTNFGTTAIDLGTLWYDDESADVSVADPISSRSVAPGAAAVVLIGTAADLAEFEAVWGTGIDVAFTDGAGLGQSGDAVNLFDSIAPGTLPFESAGFPSLGGINLATWSLAPDGSGRFTQPGDLGAYLSNPFLNETLAGSGGEVQILGSPGVAPVPVPPALGFMAAGLVPLLKLRRRR